MRVPQQRIRIDGVAIFMCGLLALLATVGAKDVCLEAGAPCTDSSECCGECFQDECPTGTTSTSPAARRSLQSDCPALCGSLEEDEAAYAQVYGEVDYVGDLEDGDYEAEEQGNTALTAGEDAETGAGADTGTSPDAGTSLDEAGAEADSKDDGDGSDSETDCADPDRACSDDVKCCGTRQCKGGTCTAISFKSRFKKARESTFLDRATMITTAAPPPPG